MEYKEITDNGDDKKRKYQEYYEMGLKDAGESTEKDEDKRGAKKV